MQRYGGGAWAPTPGRLSTSNSVIDKGVGRAVRRCCPPGLWLRSRPQGRVPNGVHTSNFGSTWVLSECASRVQNPDVVLWDCRLFGYRTVFQCSSRFAWRSHWVPLFVARRLGGTGVCLPSGKPSGKLRLSVLPLAFRPGLRPHSGRCLAPSGSYGAVVVALGFRAQGSGDSPATQSTIPGNCRKVGTRSA